MSKYKNGIKECVKERDNAIIMFWTGNGMEALDKYMKRYCESSLIEAWNKSSTRIKILTICNMTLNITSATMHPYYEVAREYYKDITGKDFK